MQLNGDKKKKKEKKKKKDKRVQQKIGQFVNKIRYFK